MAAFSLSEVQHPSDEAAQRFEELVGLEEQKQRLLGELLLLLAPKRLEDWLGRHHPKGLPMADVSRRATPLVLLSGEVGCGKTALATTVATPLAQELGERVLVMETPSDIRGSGLVGELSSRVTSAFTQAKAKAGGGYALLVMDEADDLALSRSELQAHHEDRAGLNVLIKQLDLLTHQKARLAVIMITNRAGSLDPAVMRRVALSLEFKRPGPIERRYMFERLLRGCRCSRAELDHLVKQSDREVPYSYSDIMHRVARAALLDSWRMNEPFGPLSLLAALIRVQPSPLMEENRSS
jgi:SpoVK/Ycf46/Vps4 family AAA+-type ATPase